MCFLSSYKFMMSNNFTDTDHQNVHIVLLESDGVRDGMRDGTDEIAVIIHLARRLSSPATAVQRREFASA